MIKKIIKILFYIYDRVFFAGEATAYAYSTVHGADRSGRRAVGQLITSSALA
jgi:monoamine oxidase